MSNRTDADTASAYVASLTDAEFASFVAATREPTEPDEPSYPAAWKPRPRQRRTR
ncbi:hypothetical protein [Nocardia aurea]|uniref:hypothetical protein n=1 Tax=Nocardia aurea TaxID=2144174 RepID=UPI0013003882|nr:hypothetical protein [Nocardia aurea]